MIRAGVLFLGLLLALGACATPLEQCLYAADRDLRALERDLNERQLALARGYSIERIIVPRMVASVCGGPGGAAVPCMRWEQDIDEVQHRINPEIERERIALLERQVARERARVTTAQAQCRTTYPA